MTRIALPGVAVLAAAIIWYAQREPSPTTVTVEAPTPSTAVAARALPVTDEFGIDAGLYEVASHRIARNETLSDILRASGHSFAQIAAVAEAARHVFDPRDLRAGKKYHLYSQADSSLAPRYFVYEHNTIEYVVFDLGVEPAVRRGERPVTVTTRTASGEIKSSLYQTLVDEGLDVLLANELAEVFAWQIDFYRIMPGDRFRVVYDERRIKDRAIGIERIQAAVFSHRGEDYFAFHFPEEGEVAYFDERGQNLRKAFLMSPVKYSRVSSQYSGRRFHPVLKRYRAHLGTDYAATNGTPIRATGDGIVAEATRGRANGIYVKLKHNGVYSTAYLHMSRIEDGIEPGVRVRQGDVIGYVGSTGLATGSHVCYRFWKSGSQVDPRREVFPSADPVSEEHLTRFDSVRMAYIQRLNGIGRPTLSAPVGAHADERSDSRPVAP